MHWSDLLSEFAMINIIKSLKAMPELRSTPNRFPEMPRQTVLPNRMKLKWKNSKRATKNQLQVSPKLVTLFSWNSGSRLFQPLLSAEERALNLISFRMDLLAYVWSWSFFQLPPSSSWQRICRLRSRLNCSAERAASSKSGRRSPPRTSRIRRPARSPRCAASNWSPSDALPKCIPPLSSVPSRCARAHVWSKS